MKSFKSSVSFKPENKPSRGDFSGTKQEKNKKPINPTKLLKAEKLDFPTSNKPPFAC